MIETVYLGRLGNQIFQYCFSRIIAEELGYEMPATLPGFPNAGPVSGAVHTEPVQELVGHQLDLDAVLADRRPRKVVARGYFQRYSYYAPYADRIRRWLSLEDCDFRKPDPGTLVLHVRGGDLYGEGGTEIHPYFPPVPFRHYASIVERNTDATGLAIVCENPRDVVVQKLAERYDAEVVHQSPLEDFYFLTHASEVALSMSTFAWWAAWLSDAERIHMPLIGLWHPDHVRTDVDNLVPEERYVYTEIGPGDDWKATPEQVADVLRD